MNQQLKKKIIEELAGLDLMLGDKSRVEELVKTFVDKTPGELDTLGASLAQGDADETARIVHKIKIRYGYFGLHSIVNELERWEEHIKRGEQLPETDVKVADIKQQTTFIIEELKKTEYFANTGQGHNVDLPLNGKLVLIAEDDEVNGMVFELFIRETGATTVLATDGMQALTLATANRPDLVFMDVHMPFFSGLDAIRELRKQGCECPIVSLSASTRLNERENSFDAGASEFLIKPVNRDTIKKVLFKYLSK